jgi:hypothetical protein
VLRLGLIALLLGLSVPALATEGDRSDLSSETVLDVTQAKDVADRSHQFEESLKTLGFSGRLVSCQGMVDLPAGVEAGDHAYGAVCKLDQGGHQSDVMLCDDTLFGHFAMKSGRLVNTRDAIAMFADENCTGD